MQWYYTEGGPPIGPILEAEFWALVEARVITGSTAVWRPGMQEWLPWREVEPTVRGARSGSAFASPSPEVPSRSSAAPSPTEATPAVETNPTTRTPEASRYAPPAAVAPAAFTAPAPEDAGRPASGEGGITSPSRFPSDLAASAGSGSSAPVRPPPSLPGTTGPRPAPTTAGLLPGSIVRLQPGQAICWECAGLFPEEATVHFNGASICPSCKPVYLQRFREGSALKPGVAYAGFGLRFAAKLIDTVILWFANLIVTIIVTLFAHTIGSIFLGSGPTADTVINLIMALVQFTAQMLVTALYEIVFTAQYAATPGKMVVGIKVVRGGDGGKVSWGRATIRFLGQMVCWFTCCVGYLIMLVDPEQRTIYDMMANTRVVKRNPSGGA